MVVAVKSVFSPERRIEVYQDLAEAILAVALEDVKELYAEVENAVYLDQSGALEDWFIKQIAKRPDVNEIDLLPLPTRHTFDLVEFFAPDGWGPTLMSFCGIFEAPDVLIQKVEVLRQYRDQTFPLLARYQQEYMEKNQPSER